MANTEDFEYSPLSQLEELGLLKVSSVGKPIDLSDETKFKKISFTDYEQIQMHGLLSQMPMVAAAGAASSLCILTFPKGVTGVLTKLKQGGWGTMLKGPDGKFVGTASIVPAGDLAVVMQAFTVMSVASSQYFLAKINDQLKMINLKIDKILGFLYGDKKAELLSELSYAKRAYENYHSLMSNDHQRTATLIGIQQSAKVALKDIEFYIQDLHTTVGAEAKSAAQLGEMFENAMQIRDSLNLSLQLYVMCCMLEIYFSQNTDPSFISNLEHELVSYIEKCNSRMLDDLSTLKAKLTAGEVGVRSKIPLGQKFDTDKAAQALSEIIDSIHEGETLSIRDIVHESMRSVTQEVKLYVDSDRNFYYKIS